MPSYPFTQNSAPVADESSPSSRVGPYRIDTAVSVASVQTLHPDLSLRGSTTPVSATNTPYNSRPTSPASVPAISHPLGHPSHPSQADQENRPSHASHPSQADQENRTPNTVAPARTVRTVRGDRPNPTGARIPPVAARPPARRQLFAPLNTAAASGDKIPSEKN